MLDRAFANALVEIGDPSALPVFIKKGFFLDSYGKSYTGKLADKSAVGSRNSLLALHEKDNRGIVWKMFQALSGNDAEKYRAEISFVLRTMGEGLVPHLIKELENPKNHEYSQNYNIIIYALKEIGDVAVPELVDLLKRSSSSSVRESVIALLGEIGNKEAVSALFEVLTKDDSNSEVRTSAIYALGKVGDGRSIRFLRSVLNHDSDPNVRQSAVRVLGEIGNRESVPELCKALSDPDEFVVSEAAYALGKIGDRSAVPALKAALTATYGKNMRNYRDIAIALANMGDLSAVPAILNTCRDDGKWLSFQERESGISPEILAKLGEQAVPELIKALRDPDEFVREVAAGALGRIGDTTAIAPLKKALANVKDGESDELVDSLIWAIERLEHQSETPKTSD